MYNSMKWFVILLIAAILISGCASTKLTHIWVDETYKGKVFSDILVIAVSNQEGVRRSFEEKFIAELKQAGVDAVSSADAIAIPANKELKKETILKAVQKYNNDAVIITHLIGVEKKDVYYPPTRVYPSYYGYYHSAHVNVNQRGYYKSNTFVRLETNLYDVKTEKPVWSGQSETWEPGSDQQIIDEVIKIVIGNMRKKGLLPMK
ncbi:hypothetical protein ACFL9T_00440 [Thermodesulfobacteriota bacterium]